MENVNESQDLQSGSGDRNLNAGVQDGKVCSDNTHEGTMATENKQGVIEISDDMYIDDLIQTQENTDDIEHVEELINNDSTKGQSDQDMKSTLQYLDTMREVAKANNISLDDFTKILFNSNSVKVESVSPKSSLRRKLSSSKNQRKTKFANQVYENKKSAKILQEDEQKTPTEGQI